MILIHVGTERILLKCSLHGKLPADRFRKREVELVMSHDGWHGTEFFEPVPGDRHELRRIRTVIPVAERQMGKHL